MWVCTIYSAKVARRVSNFLYAYVFFIYIFSSTTVIGLSNNPHLFSKKLFLNESTVISDQKIVYVPLFAYYSKRTDVLLQSRGC